MPLIKRYSNRKLYDTEGKRYITLDGIAELIREGMDVQVIDHESGDDVTALISAQIVLAQEKKTGGLIPRTMFTTLINAGSNKLNQLRQTIIPHADLQSQVDAEIERRVQALIEKGEFTKAEGKRVLKKLLLGSGKHNGQNGAAAQAVKKALKKGGIPSRAQLERLTRHVNALNAELDQLIKAEAEKSK